MFSTPRRQLHAKAGLRISTLTVFYGRGWIARAALLKTAHWAVFAPSSVTGPQLFESARIENPNFLQTENRQRISTLTVFLWARVDYASRASKKAPQELFSPPDCSAGRCCSNPPLRVKLKMPDKTKNQRNFYAGLFMCAGGFEPPKLKSSRFTVCPHWPLGNTPIFYLQSSLTACIFYHLKWHLSTTFSTDFLIFCRSLFSCVLPQ